MGAASAIRTRASLRDDLERLGVRPGDTVMVHAALSRVGPMLNGPDAVIGALLDAVGKDGTALAYTDWDARYDELLGPDGRVPEEWRPHIPPYDARTSRAARGNGALPEFLRTWPGARRSGNPGASVAALGAGADELTADHPLDYGYGEGSPLARLVADQGKVLLLGAPLDTITLLHHAEHLAQVPHKRVIRYEVPFAAADGTVQWRMLEEFDTAEPVVAGLDEDYFAAILSAFLASGHGGQATVGAAASVLVEARTVTGFAVQWLQEQVGRRLGREGQAQPA